MTTQQLSLKTLETILEAQDLSTCSLGELIELVQAEEGVARFKPDGICQTDPRSGDRIIYNSARALRPHDNRPAEEATAAPAEKECVVCQGKTTGVIDVASLSEGFTFINKNLFPVLYPEPGTAKLGPYDPGPAGTPVFGLHLLQWTSSYHHRDWHNMPHGDRIIALKRLGILEEKLLFGHAPQLPNLYIDEPAAKTEPARFVSIFKNYGHLVGGSLEHGHQQIGLSNVMPGRVRNNWQFAQQRQQSFSAYMLAENPPALQLRDYGPAVLLVPYFMRRPFDMMLLLKDTEKQYLHQLNDDELAAVAEGWHDAIRAIRWIMPRLDRDTSYNVVTHNGPGAGLYFEFLPYTQETGGFEHLGVYVCQANPHDTAAQIRKFLNKTGGTNNESK